MRMSFQPREANHIWDNKREELPLISVVVPVYNVEAYLEACVKSLMSQTYPNIELILIDDGSTDASPDLCELIASQCSKISAYHKENGGLSSARNYGVKVAHGKYLAFVDSDDIVSLDFIQVLYQAIAATGSQIASVPFISLPSQEFLMDDVTHRMSAEAIAAKDALTRLLLRNGINESACGKLASKETWSSHPFPEGKVYEDLSIMCQVIDSAEHIALIDVPLYGQVYRSGSITRSNTITSRQFLDYREAMDSCCKYVQTKYGKELSRELQSFKTLQCIRFYRLSLDVELHNTTSATAAAEARAEIKEQLFRTLFNTFVPMSTKLKALLITASPRIYDLLYKAFQRKKSRSIR